MLVAGAFLKVSVLIALLGTIPLVFAALSERGRNTGLSGARPNLERDRSSVLKAPALAFVIYTVLLWPWLYLAIPSLFGPWWGAAGFCVWALWIVSTVVAQILRRRFLILTLLLPIGLTIAWLLSGFVRSSEMLNAGAYGSLIGTLDTRIWTQDIQPKSAEHVRTNSNENAAYMAKQALGQDGAIGSQFRIGEGITQQKINNDFWYVVPLDHMSWSTWLHTSSIPAYIRVSGQDPYRSAELIRLPKGQELVYTPSAYWGCNLQRHLWAHGFASTGLIEYVPEVDESGKLWYVVTMFDLAIGGWSGRRATGVLIIDPVTGDIKQEPLQAIDEWLDRVIPPELVQQNIRYKGLYPEGDFWNTVGFGIGARKGLTEPEESNLVYGSDNDLYWVTGVTALSNATRSLVGLYYSNTRTGKTVYYAANGATDTAIVAAINKNRDVQYRHLHGVSPQIYNIGGVMTAIIPMMNDNDAYQGLGFVNVQNLQLMAFSPRQEDAYESYLAVLSESGHQVSPDAERRIQPLQGVVDRFFAETSNGETTFYLHLAGTPHIFSASSVLSGKLRLTKAGDRITGLYVANGAEVEPLRQFDNLSLLIESGTATGTDTRSKQQLVDAGPKK